MKKYIITKKTGDKIANSLCKMRGAALKLGQVLSTMEDSTIPPLIKSALERARAEADFLPDDQLIEALKAAYGENWKDNFSSFKMNPIAAASIGQVHEAYLKEDNVKVAVKIQYPGIAECVDQDINNFRKIIKCKVACIINSNRNIPRRIVYGKLDRNYKEGI